MSKLRIGIVGAGNIAVNAHLPAYKDCDNMDVVAICDLDADRAREAAEKFGIPASFGSVEEMLANVEYEVTVEDKSKDWVEYLECVEQGEATHLLKFYISKNPNKTSRKANINLVSETNEKVIITIQQNAGGIIVNKNLYEAPSKQSKSFEVEIEAYAEIADIKTEDGKEWIQYLECADVENSYKKILKFYIDKNTEAGEREMVVTIVSETEEETSFTIKQRGKDSVSNAEDVAGDIVVPVDNITSSASGSYGGTVPQNLILCS